MQPSRARSKNGLFIAFGTSAKTKGCCASLRRGKATRPAPTTPAATTPASNNRLFIVSSYLLRILASKPPAALPLRRPSSAELLQQHRENDEHADERALPVRVDPGEQQGVADDLDERGADQRAVGAAFAADQVGAADHR